MLSERDESLLEAVLKELKRRDIMAVVIGFMLHKNGGSITINKAEYYSMFEEFADPQVDFSEDGENITLRLSKSAAQPTFVENNSVVKN